MTVEEERHLNVTIKVLKEQVEVFRDRIQPTETGHLHTAINVMSHRITELEQKKPNNQVQNSGLLPKT